MISTTVVAAQAAGGNSAAPILMMVASFAIMYFFMIRPQQKKQKAIRNFQNSLQEGARVVTSGGVYGEVKRINLEKNTLELEVARGVIITVDRNYVFADPASLQSVSNNN